MPMLVGLLARLVFLLLDYSNVFTPPGGGADAVSFTRRAQEWSMLDWSGVFSTFNYSASYVYSTFGAILYKLVGFHDLILPSVNVFLGVFVVAIPTLIVYSLWGRRSAVIACYIMALFPFAMFNSVIALREEPSIFLFLVGLYFFLSWVSEKHPLRIFIALPFFAMAIIVHPGWIGALVGVSAYLGFVFIKNLMLFLKQGSISRSMFGKLASSLGVFIVALLFVIGSGGVTLAKGITVGGESGSEIDELIESRFEREAQGGSAYPRAVATGNPFTQPWLIPARMVYFTLSPFPWDIKSGRHLLGTFATVLYGFLVFYIYKGWPKIKRKEECIALLFIFGSLIFVFSIGVTNVGTAIRHRTKFLALFLILAASSFHRLKKIRFRRG